MAKTIKPALSLGLLSRYRNEIYGICALWIVGFHAVGLFGIDLTFNLAILGPFEWFLSQNLGVDVFLLLSGISCYYSYATHPEPGRFISRRLARIWPALLVTYGASWLLSVLVGSQALPWFLWNMSLIPFFVEGNLNGTWYFSFIVLMYLLYPYFHRFIYGDTNRGGRLKFARTILLMVLAALLYRLPHKYALDWFNLVESGFARVPIFVLGCYLGHHVERDARIGGREIALGITLSAAWALFCYGYVLPSGVWWWRLPFSFGGVVFTMLFIVLLESFGWIAPRAERFMGRVLKSVGSYSLELYATHLIVFYGGTRVLPKMGQSLTQFAFYFVVSCVWARLAVWVLEPLLVKGLRSGARMLELRLGGQEELQ